MLLYLEKNATISDVKKLENRLEFMGFGCHYLCQENAIVITHGLTELVDIEAFKRLPHVIDAKPYQQQFKLVGKRSPEARTVITLNHGIKLGDGSCVVMAGPCSIESRQQILTIADYVSREGGTILRGGAFKPRTSPYDFQGLGEAGLAYMREAADKYQLACISEVMAIEAIDLVANYVDMIQVGARNMQNFNLLKALGRTRKPVMLKRGLSATYKELLNAAEYIMSSGNHQVMLCERGIRTFESYSRNTLDLAAVPILRELTHLPIVVDPSHGVGLRKIVPEMAKAALAAGTDAIMVETHIEPDASISDAKQTISPESYASMMQQLQRLALALDRPMKTKAETAGLSHG